jgi:hypothetical protein
MTDTNYYDTFIDSILALPSNTRSFILNCASMHAKDNNPYLYLWELYCKEENENDFIHKLLDDNSLAID